MASDLNRQSIEQPVCPQFNPSTKNREAGRTACVEETRKNFAFVMKYFTKARLPFGEQLKKRELGEFLG